jgi:hypothetical protein
VYVILKNAVVASYPFGVMSTMVTAPESGLPAVIGMRRE